MGIKDVKRHRNLALMNGLVIGVGIGIILLGASVHVFFKALEPYAETTMTYAFVQSYIYTAIISLLGVMICFLATIYEMDRRRKIDTEEAFIYR